MSVAILKSLAFTFCTPDGESGIAVQKCGGGVKSFSIGLETDNRSRIGLETWGDNNARVDNKVDNKVYNNTRGDIKVDNNVEDYAEKHPQTRTRTTPVHPPYNKTQFRTTPVLVQDPNETDYQPTRKRLNHRGPLSIDVSSAWYFITICADGHAPWIADEVKIGRAIAPRPYHRRIDSGKTGHREVVKK